ncbi:hypothetical protein DSO57_1019667 [Entomophthora muscae]|uniref:Uncharacterized protein n=1 Tax=Entomophthora muscae TaxID=34485 RepID=A0ACC2RIM8_9FUNG|nr:hypothetical protein DSO57_1019667 [Entomophthora muscae]
MDRLIHGRYTELRAWERLAMKGIVTSCKFLVRSVPHASMLTLLYLMLVPGRWTLNRLLVVVLCLCEVGFFLYWKLRISRPFQRKPSALSEEERATLCRNLVENVEDMEDMLARWLVERPSGPFQKEHYIDWIVWMLFDKKAEELTVNEEAQLKRLVPQLLINIDQSISKPSKKKYLPIRPSIDTMNMQPKPFVLYVLIKCIQALGFITLYLLGFRRSKADGLTYWHSRGHSMEPPILYIHGIGIGFAMYMAKLIVIGAFHKHRRIFLLELPHISMEITDVIPDHDETLNAIDTIFKTHSLEKVSVVGHSYGTVLASWLMRERPCYLSRLTLVDPVCFCMWDSTLARNFLYSKPISFVHELALFFISSDPLIAHTVSKELYWNESVLYPKDISVPARIFLSAHDWVVDATICNDYLQKRLPSHCKVELMETSHGGCLGSKLYLYKIAQCI